MFNKDEVWREAFNRCMKEMYAKAQPSADWDQILEDFKNGKYDKDTRIFERYYLSKEEFDYILDKYIKAYGFEEKWNNYVDIVADWFNTGGTKEVYNKITNRREYKDIPKILDELKEFLSDKDANKVNRLINSYLDYCKKFYKFDRNEYDFRCAIALGASPTCNPKTVIDYWKSQGIDVEIEERIPELFWYYDMGYTEEELAEEFEYLGDNWKEELYKEWKQK